MEVGKQHLKYFCSCGVIYRGEFCLWLQQSRAWRKLSLILPLFTEELAPLILSHHPPPPTPTSFPVSLQWTYSSFSQQKYLYHKGGKQKSPLGLEFQWYAFEKCLSCSRHGLAPATAWLVPFPCQTPTAGSPPSKQLEKVISVSQQMSPLFLHCFFSCKWKENTLWSLSFIRLASVL